MVITQLASTETQKGPTSPEGGVFLSPELLNGSRDAADRYRSLWEFSNLFWATNNELLGEGFGMIAQGGLNQEGQFANTGDRTGDTSLTLVFGTRAPERSYLWQLAVADRGARSLAQLSTRPGGDSSTSYNFDSQGILRQQREMTHDETSRLARLVVGLASHHSVAETTRILFERKHNLEKVLGGYSVSGLSDSPEKYQRQIDKLQARINSIGFIALGPFEPPSLPANSESQSTLW